MILPVFQMKASPGATAKPPPSELSPAALKPLKSWIGIKILTLVPQPCGAQASRQICCLTRCGAIQGWPMACDKPQPKQNAMPKIPIVRGFKTTLLVLLATVAMTGCSKKAEKPTATVPPVNNETATTTAVTTTPAAPDIIIQVMTDIKQPLAVADAALKAKEYDKAVQSLLAVQKQKQSTDQQAGEALSRMVGLQRNLAAAIAAGDPSAKAAGELLRRSV